MRACLRGFLFAAGIVGMLFALNACTQSEENAVQEGLNPATPIRKAFAVSLEVTAQQIAQYDSMNGQVPQGDGVLALQQAGMRTAPTTDPWGNEVRYHGQGSHFTLSSAGPDGQWGTKDDIIIKR